MRSTILSRDDVSPEVVHREHYASDGLDRDLVVEILTHVAGELRVPVSKLRPTDRFEVELAPARGDAWDSGMGILLLDLQRMAKRRGVRVEGAIVTVDDDVRAMAEVYT